MHNIKEIYSNENCVNLGSRKKTIQLQFYENHSTLGRFRLELNSGLHYQVSVITVGILHR
jgi:hypothetical protein